MTVFLSAAEYRRLVASWAGEPVVLESDAVRRPRRRSEPYHTRCADCGESFTVVARETEHLHATGHGRYDLVVVSGP